MRHGVTGYSQLCVILIGMIAGTVLIILTDGDQELPPWWTKFLESDAYASTNNNINNQQQQLSNNNILQASQLDNYSENSQYGDEQVVPLDQGWTELVI